MASRKIPVPPRLDKPVGDPVAMKAMAEACRAAARQLRGGANVSQTAVDTMFSSGQFRAPAAHQLLGVVSGNSGAAIRANNELMTFVHQLDAGADRLEQEYKRYNQREREVQRARDHNSSVDVDDEFGVDSAGSKG